MNVISVFMFRALRLWIHFPVARPALLNSVKNISISDSSTLNWIVFVRYNIDYIQLKKQQFVRASSVSTSGLTRVQVAARRVSWWTLHWAATSIIVHVYCAWTHSACTGLRKFDYRLLPSESILVTSATRFKMFSPTTWPNQEDKRDCRIFRLLINTESKHSVN